MLSSWRWRVILHDSIRLANGKRLDFRKTSCRLSQGSCDDPLDTALAGFSRPWRLACNKKRQRACFEDKSTSSRGQQTFTHHE